MIVRKRKRVHYKMKITSLLENTTVDENFKTEHGLSLYIETTTHKILFDM